MKAQVPEEHDGDRADLVLARVAGMSRRDARRVIEGGGLLVDGEAVEQPRIALPAGATLAWKPPPPPQPLQRADVAFGVAYEDEHLAVVDKPAGVVTHPGAGDTGATLAAGILHRWPRVRGVGEQNRWGIVHRLDRDTSGLLVVALDAETHGALAVMMRKREVHREYLALVAGDVTIPTGTIDAAIGRDPRRPTRRRVDPGGRRAVTHYRVETAYPGWTLLRVRLETGRTHQIRVHLASIGLPVAGDRVYGTGAGSPRVFLHSTALAFRHPSSGEEVAVTSPLPADLQRVLQDHEKKVRDTS